jgi:hypothetical protein
VDRIHVTQDKAPVSWFHKRLGVLDQLRMINIADVSWSSEMGKKLLVITIEHTTGGGDNDNDGNNNSLRIITAKAMVRIRILLTCHLFPGMSQIMFANMHKLLMTFCIQKCIFYT